MIVITGATGALGGAAVEHLLAHVSADRIGVSVRDVAKARHFADRGVRVRRASYDDPAALRDSFEGAERVLLVSQNDPGGDGTGLHRTAIEAAVAAGAQRILYTSHQNVRGDSPVGGQELRHPSCCAMRHFMARAGYISRFSPVTCGGPPSAVERVRVKLTHWASPLREPEFRVFCGGSIASNS